MLLTRLSFQKIIIFHKKITKPNFFTRNFRVCKTLPSFYQNGSNNLQQLSGENTEKREYTFRINSLTIVTLYNKKPKLLAQIEFCEIVHLTTFCTP